MTPPTIELRKRVEAGDHDALRELKKRMFDRPHPNNDGAYSDDFAGEMEWHLCWEAIDNFESRQRDDMSLSEAINAARGTDMPPQDPIGFA